MLVSFTEKGFPFEWKDVFDPTPEELKSLASTYKLPEAAVIDCMQSEHLPKFEIFEDYNFVIMRFYDVQCKVESDNIQSLTRKVAIFYNKNFLLTIHRSKTAYLADLSDRYANNHNVHMPFDMVCKIIKNAFETFDSPLTEMDKEIDNFEKKIFLKKRIPDLLKNLYLIKRKTYVFKKLNTISQNVVESMVAGHKHNSFYEDMRDYHLKLDTTTDDLHDNINNLLNIYISLASQKTNEVMRILTVFSAFFLPLTFIVGIYGMNFDYMPELREKWGYPGVIILMALITLTIFLWFKRKKWL